MHKREMRKPVFLSALFALVLSQANSDWLVSIRT